MSREQGRDEREAEGEGEEGEVEGEGGGGGERCESRASLRAAGRNTMTAESPTFSNRKTASGESAPSSSVALPPIADEANAFDAAEMVS